MKNHLAPMLIMIMLCSAAVFSADMPPKKVAKVAKVADELEDAATKLDSIISLMSDIPDPWKFNNFLENINTDSLEKFKDQFNKSDFSQYLNPLALAFSLKINGPSISISPVLYDRNERARYFQNHPKFIELLAIYLFINNCAVENFTINDLTITKEQSPYTATLLKCLSVKPGILWMNLKMLSINELEEGFNYELFSECIIKNTSIETLCLMSMKPNDRKFHCALAQIISGNTTIKNISLHYVKEQEMNINYYISIHLALKSNKNISYNGPQANPELIKRYMESKHK